MMRQKMQPWRTAVQNNDAVNSRQRCKNDMKRRKLALSRSPFSMVGMIVRGKKHEKLKIYNHKMLYFSLRR
jgi:hypothetical protein